MNYWIWSVQYNSTRNFTLKYCNRIHMPHVPSMPMGELARVGARKRYLRKLSSRCVQYCLSRCTGLMNWACGISPEYKPNCNFRDIFCVHGVPSWGTSGRREPKIGPMSRSLWIQWERTESGFDILAYIAVVVLRTGREPSSILSM